MGWRDQIREALAIGGMTFAEIERFILAMPPADRIALARELLAGTGRVVAIQVSYEESPEHGSPDDWAWGFHEGWNACRAAMMQKRDGDEA